MTYFSNYVTLFIKWIQLIDEQKGDFRITKNYQDITLTAIAAKIYNTMFLNFIWSEDEKVLLSLWQFIESSKKI